MKKIALTALTLVFASSAYAVLPEKNEVVDQLCGNLNRSVTVCVAESYPEGNKYVYTRHFLGRVAPTYVAVKGKDSSTPGMKIVTYTGRTVVLDAENNNLPTERTYELKVTTAMNHERTTKAVLKIDGKQSGPEVRLEAVIRAATVE